MQTAQRLYEGIDLGGETVGLITYMRTDGVQIAPEAVSETREVIGKDFGASICRRSRASILPKPRMRRKPTKPVARHRWPGIHAKCRPTR